ncbi:Helix-turn-helix motif [hydrothermal vent metagenome]|uniref:Helix-turn-helix motif n=1 Tax=hydrothermal vent metagenome TaxID=652676 RepID=A0A3B0X306_9ZZZZ
MATVAFDNIFDAVTDNAEEALELQTRADLMIVLRDIIDEKNWTQKEAGKQLGLTQPRVSDLKNGKIRKFSIDMLMACLHRLGFRFRTSYQNQTLTIDIQTVA